MPSVHDSRRPRTSLGRALAPALAVIAAFAAALATHGCATPSGSGEINTDKEYRTGSNIPVRDRASRGDAASYDPASVQDAISKSPPPPPRGLKGG